MAGHFHHRKRKDSIHKDVVAALERCGWVCLDTSSLGDGAPDVIAARSGVTVAIEIKSGTEPLRPKQIEWMQSWPGRSAVVRHVDQAVALNMLLDGDELLMAGSYDDRQANATTRICPRCGRWRAWTNPARVVCVECSR